jgi:hypothetical protein
VIRKLGNLSNLIEIENIIKEGNNRRSKLEKTTNNILIENAYVGFSTIN